MTTPNGEGPEELADMPHLSDVQATDALLDRLAARTPTTDDLDDPVIADLVQLTEFADASPVPPPGIDRLIEVLGGRPLYMFDRGSAAATEADEPIQLDTDGRADQPAARMIDLSDASAVPAGEAGQDEEFDGVAARATGSEHGSSVVALALIRSMRSARRPVTKAGWQGALQQVALPAASVVALLALGGGVSAVVTGDPMSPVYGITKVASALPGIDNPSEKKLKSANQDLRSAQAAVGNDNAKAQRLLASAQSKVDDVPQENQQALSKQIQSLRAKVSVAAAAATPSATVSPTPTPSVTSSPVETAEPTQAPVTEPPTTTPETSTPDDTTTTSPSTGSDATVDGAGTDGNAAGD